MSIKKTSLQQALLEAKEIEKSALENAKKFLEESITPQIEKAVKESLKELEKENSEIVNEEVKIDIAPGAELKINVSSDGTATVETGKETSTDNKEENTNSETNMEDKKQPEEEMYEVEDISEVDAPPVAPTSPEVATPEASAPIDAPTEAPSDISTELEQINQKLDSLLANEENKEAGSGEQSAEGNVEIVDDETPEGATPGTNAAPATVTAEDGVVNEYDMEDEGQGHMQDEVVYEVEDDVKDMFDEMDAMEEIEIVDGHPDMEENYEEEGIEEDSLALRHRAGQRGKVIKKVPLGKHAPHSQAATGLNESKIKAQYESAIDELKKENESLKGTIKEYKESFVVIRKQINEVQIFNAKLAYANKLFTNGGLTNDEKIKIAEEFDKVETIEEAKKLYNKLMTEANSSKTTKTSPVEKLKSVKPAAVPASSNNTQTLYESDEFRRMRKLAGIIKENN